MGISDQWGWTAQEIRAMAHAAYTTRSVHPVIGLDRQTAEVLWAGMPDELHAVWEAVARVVLEKNPELALERLARDLLDPNSTASKLREELRGMTCPHCGRPLEEEREGRGRRGRREGWASCGLPSRHYCIPGLTGDLYYSLCGVIRGLEANRLSFEPVPDNDFRNCYRCRDILQKERARRG